MNKEAERHLTPSAPTPTEGKTREVLERADPLVPTVSDEAGQERSMSLNMIPPAQGQHQSKHTLKKEGSQFLPNHCYDPIANEISGDLYTLKNQGSQVLRIVVLAVNEEDVPKGSMEMEISGATNLGLDSNLDTNLARIGLDSKESLNIPVMFPMKDNRNLAPKVEILWVIDRGKQNQKINLLKMDQMKWKLKMKQRLIGCTLLPRKLMIKMRSKGEHDQKSASL